MKKEDVISTIVYLVMLAIVILVGYFIIQTNANDITAVFNNSNAIYGFVIISLVIGVILNVALLEIGHAIGAKIGGYDILSFNIFGLCFYKVFVNEKMVTKFGFKNFDGLAGETRISPKPNKDKHNPIFYIVFPFFLVLAEFLALILAYTFIDDASSLVVLKYGLVLVTTMGGLFILYDYIPVKLDSLNDGYRYTLLVKKINTEAFNERLRIEGNIFLNKDDKNYRVFDEITDFTAEVNSLSLYNYYENNEYDKAKELLTKIIETTSKVNLQTKLDAKIQMLYILLKEKKYQDASEYIKNFDEKEMRLFKEDRLLKNLRVSIYYFGVIEKSYKIADDFSVKYLKEYKNELSLFKEKEKELFNQVIKEIEESKKIDEINQVNA